MIIVVFNAGELFFVVIIVVCISLLVIVLCSKSSNINHAEC